MRKNALFLLRNCKNRPFRPSLLQTWLGALPPASGGWGLHPQTSNGLRRLEALPQTPAIIPPSNCQFLVTSLRGGIENFWVW